MGRVRRDTPPERALGMPPQAEPTGARPGGNGCPPAGAKGCSQAPLSPRWDGVVAVAGDVINDLSGRALCALRPPQLKGAASAVESTLLKAWTSVVGDLGSPQQERASFGTASSVPPSATTQASTPPSASPAADTPSSAAATSATMPSAIRRARADRETRSSRALPEDIHAPSGSAHSFEGHSGTRYAISGLGFASADRQMSV